MKNPIKISLLILTILTWFGCQNVEQKPIKKKEKHFGLSTIGNDSIGVELNIAEFQDWDRLIKRTEQIVCNDSIPKVTFENDSIIKKIYFINPCWEDYACILIKEKNTIRIHNDIINKSDKYFYPLDSLAEILKKDFTNNGGLPFWSEKPEKLIIYISYEKREMRTFPETLKKVVDEYEKLNDSIELKIMLDKKFNFIPPPPPPNESIEF